MPISTPFRQKLTTAGFECLVLVPGQMTNAGRPFTCPIAAVTPPFLSFSATKAWK